MSGWVDHATMVPKNYRAEQEERGPVYESEYLTLLHAGVLKTVSCHRCLPAFAVSGGIQRLGA